MHLYKNDIERSLIEILKNIEVPDSRYEKAAKSYNSVGEWLNRENSSLKKYSPKIYIQGSFRLGTAIKPISDKDEYDVDMVCELDLTKDSVTQMMLKKMVGIELELYTNYRNMNSGIDEGKRCWTLNYSDETKFHIDVLPSIPNDKSLKNMLESYSINSSYSELAIDITDNTLKNYNIIDDKWNCSNPVGYHKWFIKQMEVIYNERRNIILESYKNYTVEDIPEYKVKTPLQQVIQLLKRHRDIMFEEDPDNKPISIIISTLAAKAYNNESKLIEAYENIVHNMENFIEKRDGIYYIYNPVNPLENFADKWQNYHERKENFFRWINQLKLDYKDLLLKEHSKIEIRDIYESMFGKIAKYDTLINEVTLNKFDTSHKQISKWKMTLSGSADIIGYKSIDGFRTIKFKSTEPLLKKTKLRFEVSTNIEQPYKTYWRVTNSGREAELADCLRGDFYDETIRKGRKTREETTSYKGLHTVECFIIKNGVCVAKSDEFIINVIK